MPNDIADADVPAKFDELVQNIESSGSSSSGSKSFGSEWLEEALASWSEAAMCTNDALHDLKAARALPPRAPYGATVIGTEVNMPLVGIGGAA